jgi:predicted dehydrogenase
MSDRKIRFGVIGLNHGHIYPMTRTLLGWGGELVSVYAGEADLLRDFCVKFPQVRGARCAEEVLDDESLQVIVSASIPDERAAVGLAAMRCGKDFFVDKPGATTLEQLGELRRCQSETRRIVSIWYGERLDSPACTKADELIQAGAIGRVIQTIGFGPHAVHIAPRTDWFYRPARTGGILVDIAAHQFDHFLHFTGSRRAEVVSAQVANYRYPQHAEFEDFGDVLLRGDGGTGYARVDWLTPRGLTESWGDGRLILLGTEGFMELRKNLDLAGRPGGEHLFLVDHKQTRHVDCSAVVPPYGERLVSDIVQRTETAMPQEECFLALELSLLAQKKAVRIGNLG